jgi:gas vesicle protein
MNNVQGIGFMQGLVLGSLVGAVIAVLVAPAAGSTTRKQIRDESVELSKRSQAFGDSAPGQAQNIARSPQPQAMLNQVNV